MKDLNKIKHGDKVMDALEAGELFYEELTRHTSLDMRTLQKTVAQLQRHDYILKTQQGRWARI